MDILAAPKPSVACDNLHISTPKPPARIHLPLYRPRYNPPKPPAIKRRKPITTPSHVLQLMDALNLPLPIDIYASLIKECTELGDPMNAIELHRHIRRSGLRLNLPFLNRILLMYVSTACFHHARQLLDEMFLRDFNSWAVVISGCVENGEDTEAMNLFVKMLREVDLEKFGDPGVEFAVSGLIVCVLKACLNTSDVKLGAQLHGWVLKSGYSRSVVVSSFLISFYGKLNCLGNAWSAFEHGSDQNTAVWTSKIMNFCTNDDFEGAIRAFKEMGKAGVRKNSYTFSTVLKACGRVGDVMHGRQIHTNLIKLGLESDGFVQCGLVDSYGKCGCLKDAKRAFEMGLESRNVASCNAMLENFMQHEVYVEAIRIVYEMKMVGLLPRESVFNELRSVCGGTDVCSMPNVV